jgi:hypothetical protein
MQHHHANEMISGLWLHRLAKHHQQHARMVFIQKYMPPKYSFANVKHKKEPSLKQRLHDR